LAGLAWGSAPFARIDAVLLVPFVALYLLWKARTRAHHTWAVFALGALALGLAHWLVHATLLAPGYATLVFSRATLAVAAGGVALVLVVCGLLWALLVWWQPRRAQARAVALVGLVALGALFAYVVRPALPALATGGEAGELEVAAQESLVRLGWYVTPLGLLLAGAGSAALVWTGGWRRTLPLLALTRLSLAFYLPNRLLSSGLPWAGRRCRPGVLSALLLPAGDGAGRLAALTPDRVTVARPVLVAGLALAVAVGEWQAVAPLRDYREQAGALAQLARLADTFPP